MSKRTKWVKNYNWNLISRTRFYAKINSRKNTKKLEIIPAKYLCYTVQLCVSHFEVPVVKILMQSSTSGSVACRVVRDLWEFLLRRMQRRGKKSAVCVQRSWPSMEGQRTCATIWWKSIPCVTKKLEKVETVAKVKQEALSCVIRVKLQRLQSFSQWSFEA